MNVLFRWAVAGWWLMASVGLQGQVPEFGAKTSPPLEVEWVSSVTSVASGASFEAGIRLIHQEHWHTYGKTLSEGIVGKPTRLVWSLPEGWTAAEGEWPAVKEVASTDGATSEGYAGTVLLPVTIQVPDGVVAGSTAELRVMVDALICDPSNCMPVKVEAKLSVKIAEETVIDGEAAAVLAAVEDSAAGVVIGLEAEVEPVAWWTLIGYAFLGGLILNVMPCVFPVLGIKIMSVVQQSGEDKRRVLLHGVAYTLGTLACFWALALILISLRSFGENLGWGFQLQSKVFVYSLTVFLFVFALNMYGVFEIGSSAVGVGQELQGKGGYAGSFFTGLLAVVVATPCAAPFLAPALGVAVTLPTIPALGFFSLIALGLASPYMVLSAFPSLLRMLPKPGAWMESFKQAMSFLLFGTVAYLLWTLEGMVDELMLRSILFGLVLVGLGCWIYGRWVLPHKSARVRMMGWIAAMMALGGGIAMGWPAEKGHELTWVPWSRELVKMHHEELKEPVYVDFTARWCVTCQTNKQVYKDREVKALIKDKGIVLLKADWTNEDPEISKVLFEFKKAAVPVNVLYIPGEKEPYILDGLDGLLTVELVKEAFAKLETKR